MSHPQPWAGGGHTQRSLAILACRGLLHPAPSAPHEWPRGPRGSPRAATAIPPPAHCRPHRRRRALRRAYAYAEPARCMDPVRRAPPLLSQPPPRTVAGHRGGGRQPATRVRGPRPGAPRTAGPAPCARRERSHGRRATATPPVPAPSLLGWPRRTPHRAHSHNLSIRRLSALSADTLRTVATGSRAARPPPSAPPQRLVGPCAPRLPAALHHLVAHVPSRPRPQCHARLGLLAACPARQQPFPAPVSSATPPPCLATEAPGPPARLAPLRTRAPWRAAALARTGCAADPGGPTPRIPKLWHAP